MLDLDRPLFRLKDVARVSGHSEKNVANWLDRGTVVPETEPPGRGRYRLVSTNAAIVMTLMSQLSALGMSPLDARRAIEGELAKHDLRRFPADLFLVVTSRHFQGRDADGSISEPSPVRFDVRSVRGAIDTMFWHVQVAQAARWDGIEQPLAATILQPKPAIELVLAQAQRLSERQGRQARRAGAGRV